MKANDHIALYAPINVYKPIATDIGIVDGSLVYMSYPGLPFLNFPFPTRMTVVKLKNGDLWLHSPTGYTPEIAEALSNIGRIAHLVSPNLLHYANIAAWKEHFPEAIAWASPGVLKRAESQRIEVQFDHELDADEMPAEWKDDLKQTVVPGKLLDEFVFFHDKSKTLIVTDTIQNFELAKMGQPARTLIWLARAYAPHGQIPLDLRATFLFNKKEIRKAAQEMLSLQPERIILSHGKNIELDAPEAIRFTFRFALRGDERA